MIPQEKIDQVMTELSNIMGVKIEFAADPEDQGRALPVYNIDAVVSKMLAFFVFTGLTVPSSFAPPYNRVHADIEWWKSQMAEIEAAHKAELEKNTEKPPEGA